MTITPINSLLALIPLVTNEIVFCSVKTTLRKNDSARGTKTTQQTDTNVTCSQNLLVCVLNVFFPNFLNHFSETVGDNLSNKIKIRKFYCEYRKIKVPECDHVEG